MSNNCETSSGKGIYMFNGIGNTFKSDVLVLGGGGGGCMAAIAAREQGVSVAVVDKAVIESSGGLGPGNCAISANLNTGPKWDTDEAFTLHFAKELPASQKIFDKTLTKRLPLVLKMLEDMGVEFFKDSAGNYQRLQTLGRPGPWQVLIKDAKYIKRKVAARVRKVGVNVFDRVMITNLLLDGNKVSGAIGFHVRTGEFYAFRAKKVILALGDFQSRAWANSSTANPYNSWQYPYNTGSQIVLACAAGAKVVNLELAPASIGPKGFGEGGLSDFTGSGAYYFNAFGERFMLEYSPMKERAPRKIQRWAVYQESIKGKGPPFYVDATHFKEEELKHVLHDLVSKDRGTWTKYFIQRGIDLRSAPFEIELGDLRSAGWVLINDRCESTISGLFAFLPRHLPGALCGGVSAGIEAAKDAMLVNNFPAIDSNVIAKEKEYFIEPLRREEGDSPQEFENIIRQVMNYYMGMVRNQKGMEIALDRLKMISTHINEIKAKNYHELMKTHELRHLLEFCELTVIANMERKESGRGYYMRSDYPDLDNKYDNKQIALWKENGKLCVSLEPIEEMK